MADEERSTRTRAMPVRIVAGETEDRSSASLVTQTDDLGESSTAFATHDLAVDDVVDELRQMRYDLSLLLTELQRLTLGLSLLSGNDLTTAMVAASLEGV